MMGRVNLSLICLASIFILASCSGGDVVTPNQDERIELSIGTNSVTCLGFWQIVIEDPKRINIVDLRSANLIANILSFLEPPPMQNLKIKFSTLDIDMANKSVGVDVILKHPLPYKRYMGFDVRGVVFGPRVENADGLTVIPSPEFFTGVPFGYQDGLLGVPDGSANYQGIAGYKYFADGLGVNDDLADFMSVQTNLDQRGVFSEGNTLSRHYDLQWTNSPQPFMTFNYGVYANYANPSGGPPITIDSFAITTSNSQEAFCFTVTETANTLFYDSGNLTGSVDLEIEVWDWQNNINQVAIGNLSDFPFAYDTTFNLQGPGSTSYSSIYTLNSYTPGGVITAGLHDLLIVAVDPQTFGESWYAGLLNPGNSLYAENIYNGFLHSTFIAGQGAGYTLPYDDPMDVTTIDRWSVEKYWGTHTAPVADWYQEGTRWVCNDIATGNYEDTMMTWLVSPEIKVTNQAIIYAEITYSHDLQTDLDFLHVGIDLVGDGETWTFFTDENTDPASGFLTGQNTGYPSTTTTTNWYLFPSSGLQPGQMVNLGFIMVADSSGHGFAGPAIDHVMLTDQVPTQIAPHVGPVLGLSTISQYGVETYSVDVFEFNGDNVTYAWEIGDDDPAQYDDGPGNGDGTIDIDWQSLGTFIVDCRVTDDGIPPLNATSITPLTVNVIDLPPTAGPSEDFEGSWPFSGWQFNDHTTIGTGEFWGKTLSQGQGCLDADGADDSCYGLELMQEARWLNVNIPSSANAVLVITHTMWGEAYTSNGRFYDGGMLFIDDDIIYDSDVVSGEPNDWSHGDATYWNDNTYMPSWPGFATRYGWSYKYPDETTWENGFATTVMDISSYADGTPHDISFLFHSDWESFSCEGGNGYTTWLIDKVEIFYQ